LPNFTWNEIIFNCANVLAKKETGVDENQEINFTTFSYTGLVQLDSVIAGTVIL
jgi:hypothetical protein